MHELTYGFGKPLGEIDFDTAVRAVVHALVREGFYVATKVDMQRMLQQKLNLEFRRYLILTAYSPMLAEIALDLDPHIGLLLPCNVVVQQANDGSVYVSVASPEAVFDVSYHPDLKPVAAEAERKLRHALKTIVPY